MTESEMTENAQDRAVRDRPGLESAGTGEARDPDAGNAHSEQETSGVADVSSPTAGLEELRQKAAQADAHWERIVRLTADLENFRKRSVREKQEAVRFANASLMEKLLPTLDSFEMALAAAHSAEERSIESFRTGMSMVQDQFRSALAEAGLEEIEATGQPFDPKWHEAVSQVESAEVPEGRVLQQVRKGYKLRERLIRPASVVVSKGPGR